MTINIPFGGSNSSYDMALKLFRMLCLVGALVLSQAHFSSLSLSADVFCPVRPRASSNIPPQESQAQGARPSAVYRVRIVDRRNKRVCWLPPLLLKLSTAVVPHIVW